MREIEGWEETNGAKKKMNGSSLGWSNFFFNFPFIL